VNTLQTQFGFYAIACECLGGFLFDGTLCPKCNGNARHVVKASKVKDPNGITRGEWLTGVLIVLPFIVWLCFAIPKLIQSRKDVEQAHHETAAAAKASYLYYLRALVGTPYNDLNCSGYISLAHLGAVLSSDQMWNGGNGQMAMVAEYDDAVTMSVHEDELQPGDVAVFLAGGHVAAYLGGHEWADSTRQHYGVTTFKMLDRAPFDYWYSSVTRGNVNRKIRVMRWTR